MLRGYTLTEITNALGGFVKGTAETKIFSIASLQSARSGQISFVNSSKYLKLLPQCQASALVLNEQDASATDLPAIVVADPYAYFAKISSFLNPPVLPSIGVANTAVIDSSAQVPDSCAIGDNVVIGANVTLGKSVVIKSGVVVENDVVIGDFSQLEPNVTIKHNVDIGRHCNIFSGAVIGSEGFGYAEDAAGEWLKIPQIGKVVINDHVDVGANTTIDRGALDDTIIETGVKLDNLIQIGHNCRIGAHTVVAGCVGIAGSATIGAHCKLGGAAMILGHLSIADHVTISPGSMITRSINKAGTYTALMPFQSHQDWLNTAANIRNIDKLSARIKQLEQTISDLNNKS